MAMKPESPGRKVSLQCPVAIEFALDGDTVAGNPASRKLKLCQLGDEPN